MGFDFTTFGSKEYGRNNEVVVINLVVVRPGSTVPLKMKGSHDSGGVNHCISHIYIFVLIFGSRVLLY